MSNESPQDVFFDDITVKHYAGALVQEQSYYPFGLQMAAISDKALKKNGTPYKYNDGSELEEELNYYNTFFRKYDAQIGRFTGVDILSEETIGLNPYHFGANNPIFFNDPTGAKYNHITHRDDLTDKFSAFYNEGFTNWNYSGGGGGYGLSPAVWGMIQTTWNNTPQNGVAVFSNVPGTGLVDITAQIVAEYYAATYTSMSNVSAVSVSGGYNVSYTANTTGNSYTDYFVSTESMATDFAFLDGLYGGNYYASLSAQSGGGGNSSANFWNNVNTVIGAFDVGQGAKGELISYAAKSSPAINDLKYVKGMKILGGATFVTSSVISGGLAINYYTNGGTDNSVWMKSALDIGMGYVGFLGPIGFGISATYFLLDAGGAFQGWGDPLTTPKK